MTERHANLTFRFLIAIGVWLLVCFCTGCATKPKARAGKTYSIAPADPGTPATASSASSVATLPVPAGSSVESVPARPATPTTPAEPATVKVVLSAPSELRVESHGESASTGTVDTTVAVKKAELTQASHDRAPLLWVAIACGVLGVVARIVVKEWPAIGNGFLAAAALAGVAWKVAEVPWWGFLGVFLVVGAIIAGYKRAEWDANKDFIPDQFQKP
jgi:hypothetical protein